MRLIYTGLLAICFTLTAVGCGGDPCADYEKKLCEDEKSKGACEKFKEQLATAKKNGTAGDMKKTCESQLANWDKRGEGAGKDEKKAEEAKAKIAKMRADCTAEGGTYSEEKGCLCADGAPRIVKKDGPPAVASSGMKIAPRDKCPKAAPPKADPPKADPPKADPPKADTPGDPSKAPTGDAPKADAPKADEAKGDAPKAEPAKGDAPKADQAAPAGKK